VEDTHLKATDNAPEVILSYSDGLIELEGRSYPENTFEFYAPMMDWVKEYFETSAKDLTTVNLEITYFNSSSSKLFFDFFDLLENASEKYNIEINWIYDEENESAEEAGEDFIEDFEDLDIKLVKK